MHSCSSEKAWGMKDNISKTLKELFGTQKKPKEIGISFVIDCFACGLYTNSL